MSCVCLSYQYQYQGLFSKKRELILTDTPRLLYVDPDSLELKGEIPWTADKPVTFVSVRLQTPVPPVHSVSPTHSVPPTHFISPVHSVPPVHSVSSVTFRSFYYIFATLSSHSHNKHTSTTTVNDINISVIHFYSVS